MHHSSQRIFAIHPEKDPKVTLPDLLQQLLTDQERTWQELAEGHNALHAAKMRNFACDGLSVTLQFNPRRIKSTTARTDEQSLRSRECFLCTQNLPVDQHGILYRDSFLILCNPAPIFDRHFTVAHVDHREQSLEAFPDIFLELARELSPFSTIFYNGPRCGASAPDHLHFQICPANILPVETLAADDSKRVLVKKDGTVSLWTLANCGRHVVVLESSDKKGMELAIRRLLEAMRKTLKVTDEPMINVLGTFANDLWRLIVFLRSKHRPEVYYRHDDDQVLISPAAVDLGGFIITPLERDFISVGAGLIHDIFREVSLDGEVIERILRAW
jgi:ATP adenylyltransferase/5',5'''-P-1,P-4-tetraphosphate phosphorylase II